MWIYTGAPIIFVDAESRSTSTKYIKQSHPHLQTNQKQPEPPFFCVYAYPSIHKRRKIGRAHPHPQNIPSRPQSTIAIGAPSIRRRVGMVTSGVALAWR